MNIVAIDKNAVKPGDTIMHNGVMRTVCASDITHCDFLGTMIFGDSYKLGYQKVSKVILRK